MIRILHISDLHASNTESTDRRVLTEAMLSDAAALTEDEPLDLIIFSGDLADSGQAEEYEIARELLIDPLMDRFGVNPGQLILVPGNHDVNRDGIREFIEQGLTENLKAHEHVSRLLESDRDLADATERLEAWKRFHTDFYADEHRPTEPGPLAFVHKLTVQGRSVGIAALDSAWRSSSPKDEGNLLLGSRQVEPALAAIEDDDLRFVVVHHPLAWIAPFDADRAREEFARRGVIVFFGHEHRSNPIAERSPYGEALYLSAGCLYDHREFPNGYSLVELDPDDRVVVGRLRRWHARRKTFDADLEAAPEGRAEFELPSADRARDLGHPPFSVIMKLIAEAAQELRVVPDNMTASNRIATVDDVLVEPRFLKVPYSEAQAAATIDAGISDQEMNPLDALDECNVLLVSGAPQAGVSSALLWLLARGYQLDASKMPARLRARQPGLGTSKTSAALAKAAAAFGHRQSESPDPDLLLAIDDFAIASPKKRARIVNFIAKNPQHRYIIGCGEEDWATAIASLDDAGVRYSRSFLGQFGRRQLRQLAKSITSGADTDIDQIDRVIWKQNLPRTPFTMTAMIAVVNTRHEDSTTLNESGFLEAYVNLLLGSSELADHERLGMDFRRRVHLLGEIARAFYDCPENSMPTLEVEKLLVTYFQDKGLPFSAGGVLQSLVSRYVLVEQNAYVSFRHPALLYLFMGYWAIEDPAHKNEMLDDCHRNRAVIRHAAGLKRNDRDLLERVGDYASKVIRDLAPALDASRVDELLEHFESTGMFDGNHLSEMLDRLPAKKTAAEIDAQSDNAVDAFGSKDMAPLESPVADEAQELTEAVELLSDVLRHSELVNDVALKQATFEAAVTGWQVFVGIVMAEDRHEESFRDLIAELLASQLGDVSELEEDENEVFARLVLSVALVLAGSAMYGRLGSWHLSSVIEAALDNPVFTRSLSATCLTTWLHARLELKGWPRRLDQLLETIPRDSFLRDTTIAIAIDLYRASPDESAVKRLGQVLVNHMTPESGGGVVGGIVENRLGQDVAKQLKQSRRAYQQGSRPDPGKQLGAPKASEIAGEPGA